MIAQVYVRRCVCLYNFNVFLMIVWYKNKMSGMEENRSVLLSSAV